MSRADIIGVLHEGDVLHPAALFEVAGMFQQGKSPGLVYGDELVVDEKGQPVAASFKPDFSLDYLLSYPYIGNCYFFSKALLKNQGCGNFTYANDYDLQLQFLSGTRKVGHISRILSKTKKTGKESPEAFQARANTITGFLHREGVDSQVLSGEDGASRVKRRIDKNPKVSIIIPTRDRADLLSRCIGSIRDISSYSNYEILVVDNASREQETKEYFHLLEETPDVRILEYPGRFNYSHINNLAAGQSEGEYLLFLNNDIEVISPGWIEALLEHSGREEVACVGAKLLYPDSTVQHAGVIIGLSGIADHVYKYLSRRQLRVHEKSCFNP